VFVLDQSDRLTHTNVCLSFTDPGSGPSVGVVAGAAVAGLLLTAAACVGVMYCRHRSSKKE